MSAPPTEPSLTATSSSLRCLPHQRSDKGGAGRGVACWEANDRLNYAGRGLRCVSRRSACPRGGHGEESRGINPGKIAEHRGAAVRRGGLRGHVTAGDHGGRGGEHRGGELPLRVEGGVVAG